MPWKAFALASSTALLLFPALAAEPSLIDTFAIAGWDGKAYANDRGEFTHCLVSAGYKSGIRLMFLMTEKYELFVRLGDDRWDLPKGEDFTVRASVDGRDLGSFDAYALSAIGIQMSLGNALGILDLLKRGERLEIQAARGTFGFKLVGTAKSLATLRACVDHHGKRVAVTANPFSSGPTASAPAADANPFAVRSTSQASPARDPRDGKSDLSAGTLKDQNIAAAILEKAGFEGFEFVDTSQDPHLLARWKGRDYYGNIKTLKSQEPPTKVLVEMMSLAAKDCRGGFTSATRTVDILPGIEAHEGIGRCGDADDWVYSAVVARDVEQDSPLLAIQSWVRNPASPLVKEAATRIGSAYRALLLR